MKRSFQLRRLSSRPTLVGGRNAVNHSEVAVHREGRVLGQSQTKPSMNDRYFSPRLETSFPRNSILGGIAVGRFSPSRQQYERLMDQSFFSRRREGVHVNEGGGDPTNSGILSEFLMIPRGFLVVVGNQIDLGRSSWVNTSLYCTYISDGYGLHLKHLHSKGDDDKRG